MLWRNAYGNKPIRPQTRVKARVWGHGCTGHPADVTFQGSKRRASFGLYLKHSSCRKGGFERWGSLGLEQLGIHTSAQHSFCRSKWHNVHLCGMLFPGMVQVSPVAVCLPPEMTSRNPREHLAYCSAAWEVPSPESLELTFLVS